jgi:hypothetical protein
MPAWFEPENQRRARRLQGVRDPAGDTIAVPISHEPSPDRAGRKDFRLQGSEFDPRTTRRREFHQRRRASVYAGRRGVVKYRGRTYLVLANEGDFREEMLIVRRLAVRRIWHSLRSIACASRTSTRPRVICAAGARSMSIREAKRHPRLRQRQHSRYGGTSAAFDNGRSRGEGVEPEGVALLDIRGRTYAFVGLERTTTAEIAVFDVSDPNQVTFLDMIRDAGRFVARVIRLRYRGRYYLAIANKWRHNQATPIRRCAIDPQWSIGERLLLW